jgi:hypothetical protein
VDAASLAPAIDIRQIAANNARRSIANLRDQVGFNAERLSL